MYRAQSPAAKQTAIVLVHYGQADLTSRCLQTLLQHCQGNFRIYLVDNASPDASLATLRQSFTQAPIVWLPQSQNLGFGAGANKGIEAALADGAEAVLLLNNDTWIEADILEPLWRRHEALQGQALLSGEIRTPADQIWYGGGNYSLWTLRVQHLKQPVTQVRTTRFISGCLLWLPASILQKVKGFDPRYFLYLEDLDLSLRASQLGIPLILVPGLKVRHEASASTGGRQSFVSIYYQNRNRWLLAQSHASPLQKAFFSAFYTLGLLRRSLKGAQSRRASWLALRDALKQHWGPFKDANSSLQALSEQRDRADKPAVTPAVD